MLADAQELSFKELLELLDKEHERSLQSLREENVRVRELWSDVVNRNGEEKRLSGDWDMHSFVETLEKSSVSNRRTKTEAIRAGITEPSLGKLAASDRELSDSGVITDVCAEALQEKEIPAKQIRSLTYVNLKSPGSFSNLGVQLWPTWSHEAAVSKLPFPDLIPYASGEISARVNRIANERSFTGPLADMLRSCPPRWSDIVMSPASRKAMMWNMIALGLLTYDVLWVPVQLAFDPPGNIITTLLDLVTMLYWTLDMVLTFFTGIYTKAGKIIKEFKPIAKQYVMGYFWLDLFIVCSDWLKFLLEHAPFSGARLLRAGKMFRFLRLARSLRLVRLVKVQEIFYVLIEGIGAESIVILCDITWKVTMILVMNHVIACVWFFVGSDSNGWVRNSGIESGTWELYLISLHWALTSFTPAQKPHVGPRTISERTFAVCMILTALVAMSTFISSVTSQMTRLRQIESTAMSNTYTLRKFLRQNSISADLSGRLTRYVELAKVIHNKTISPDKVELLKYLSGPLSVELQKEIHSPYLCWHPFFETYRGWSSRAMNRICYSAVNKDFYSKGDPIFDYCIDSEYMYILHIGTLFYLRPKGVNWDNSQQRINADRNRVMVVTAGQWFCEATLWIPWVHQGAMGTLVESEVINISSLKFQKITKEHRDAFEHCKTWAINFLKKLEQTLHGHGYLWDLPPETILSEVYGNDTAYSENDSRLQQKQRQNADLARAEGQQANFKGFQLADSDSEEDNDDGNTKI